MIKLQIHLVHAFMTEFKAFFSQILYSGKNLLLGVILGFTFCVINGRLINITMKINQ